MQQSQIPPKFPIPWGNSAGSAYIRSIPVNSQTGVQNGAASLTDGLPPLTFVPAIAGGVPPFGADFNGIFRQLSQWSQWQSAGGPIFYDFAFASAIGGYPNGTILQSAVTPGTLWLSTADNNTSNPDAINGDEIVGGSNWVQAPGQMPIGTPIQSFASVAPSGYVPANSVTIGNAASNASGRANADTQFLFNFLWVNCPNLAIFTSTGASTTRGATASADFAANKALATPEMQGAGLIGIDSGGTAFLSNVPVTQGGRNTPASILGENLHALVTAENASHNHTLTDPGHTHTVNDPEHAHDITDPGHTHTSNAITTSGSSLSLATGSGALFGIATINSATTGITVHNATTGITNDTADTGITIAASGSGTAHNTVQRSFTVNWMLKL